MNKEYYIVNVGCDDETYSTLTLNDKELKVLLRFATENNKTSGGCKPSIFVYDNKKTMDEDYFEYNNYLKGDK